MTKPIVNIFWFRRDLRLNDNAGLYHALRQGKPVVPIFIFDRNILDELEDKQDRRITFIREQLEGINSALRKRDSTLDVRYGTPEKVFEQLLSDYEVEHVFTNEDYEPYARKRDQQVSALLKKSGVGFSAYKDQVILSRDEVLKDDGTPYGVYTPYARRWKATLTDFHLKSYPCSKYARHFHKQAFRPVPSFQDIGFVETSEVFPARSAPEDIIQTYDKTRDYPGIRGTTELSVHLRFGTISIRELYRGESALNATFAGELIWREFYQMILWHHPKVQTESYKPEYDRIRWRNNEQEFAAWCTGQTGYPIVDAGMRQLNETGFMHNRVRMITASFLCKHLLIDWRWGEAYFGTKLRDYDLAANNGGWQWACGSGVDAAPYFRVFNPYLQTKKFDPELKYIRKWVPEFEEFNYPRPIVDHEMARKRCLEVYKAALAK